MLEIIALIFLTRNIGTLAEQKGLKSGPWKLYTVLAWVGAEILGIVIGMAIFGSESIFPAVLLGIGCAVTSYFIIKNTLSNKPDMYEDEINEIGQNSGN
jgi:hypothetical protein